MNAIFLHEYPLAVEPGSTPKTLVQKKSWRDSLPIYMLLSAVSFLVVEQSSSEILEGLMNNPVYVVHPTGFVLATFCVKTYTDVILFKAGCNLLIL